MASPTQWIWVWSNSGRWWRTRKPGMLLPMGSQRVGHNLETERQQSLLPKVSGLDSFIPGFLSIVVINLWLSIVNSSADYCWLFKEASLVRAAVPRDKFLLAQDPPVCFSVSGNLIPFNQNWPYYWNFPESDFPSSKVTGYLADKSVLFILCMRAHSCPTLCTPVDCSPPGSSVYGIFQAKILEWVAISSRGSSWPRDQTHVSCSSCISCIGRQNHYHWATWEAHFMWFAVVQSVNCVSLLW